MLESGGAWGGATGIETSESDGIGGLLHITGRREGESQIDYQIYIKKMFSLDLAGVQVGYLDTRSHPN